MHLHDWWERIMLTVLIGLLFGLSPVATGCSTMRNVGMMAVVVEGESPGSKEPFGGVRASSRAVANGVESLRTCNQFCYVPVVTECAALAVLIDVPLSLVGDVLTLPYCLYYSDTPPPAPSQNTGTDQVKAGVASTPDAK
jgi:hypothetical protein